MRYPIYMNTSNQSQPAPSAPSDCAVFVTQLFAALRAADTVTVDGYEAFEHRLSDDGVWRIDTASGEPDESRLSFNDQAVEVANGELQATCTKGQTRTLELQVRRALNWADLAEAATEGAAQTRAAVRAQVEPPLVAVARGAEGYDGNYAAIIEFMEAPDKTPCTCGGGCNWNGMVSELAAIEECVLTPGHASPAGRCPDCDSLAYVVEDDKGVVQ